MKSTEYPSGDENESKGIRRSHFRMKSIQGMEYKEYEQRSSRRSYS